MYLVVFYVGSMCVWVGVWVCRCVYKIEKFRTLSAPSEIASQFPPPLRSNYYFFENLFWNFGHLF
jgi:hypothetical protein